MSPGSKRRGDQTLRRDDSKVIRLEVLDLLLGIDASNSLDISGILLIPLYDTGRPSATCFRYLRDPSFLHPCPGTLVDSMSYGASFQTPRYSMYCIVTTDCEPPGARRIELTEGDLDQQSIKRHFLIQNRDTSANVGLGSKRDAVIPLFSHRVLSRHTIWPPRSYVLTTMLDLQNPFYFPRHDRRRLHIDATATWVSTRRGIILGKWYWRTGQSCRRTSLMTDSIAME